MACHAVPRVMMYQGDARPSWGRTMAEAIHGFLEGDDGEADSAKCEIMVASSVWEGAALWFDISLLITTTGALRLGCVPPAVLHCYLVHDTSTRLLYVPHVGERKYRIHQSECRWRSTRHDLVFAASRNPSIQTRTKKRRGRVFSRTAGRGVWHSLFEAMRQEGKQENKGWAT